MVRLHLNLFMANLNEHCIKIGEKLDPVNLSFMGVEKPLLLLLTIHCSAKAPETNTAAHAPLLSDLFKPPSSHPLRNYLLPLNLCF